MKKVISLVVAMAVSLLSLVSCGSGISISIYSIRLANEVKNIFNQNRNINAYTESVLYPGKDGQPSFSYEIYYERAADLHSAYNICETIGDYRLYAYEGSVYTENADGICAVLLLGVRYQDYIASYLEGTFPFDCEELNQQSSKRDGNLVTAEYHSPLTPQRAAALLDFGVSIDDTIVSHYQITEEVVDSITYSVLSESDLQPIAVRSFERSSEKAEKFASIASLEPSISIDIVFPDAKDAGRHFSVPTGVSIGFDLGKENYQIFTDESCTIPYICDGSKISESLVLYAKKN